MRGRHSQRKTRGREVQSSTSQISYDHPARLLRTMQTHSPAVRGRGRVTAELTAAAAELVRPEEAAAAAPTEVTSEMSAVERAGLYHRGGRLFITTRILVVDLLASRVRPLPTPPSRPGLCAYPRRQT